MYIKKKQKQKQLSAPPPDPAQGKNLAGSNWPKLLRLWEG